MLANVTLHNGDIIDVSVPGAPTVTGRDRSMLDLSEGPSYGWARCRSVNVNLPKRMRDSR